eukprot:6997417-Prymnesium_polylepis.2
MAAAAMAMARGVARGPQEGSPSPPSGTRTARRHRGYTTALRLRLEAIAERLSARHAAHRSQGYSKAVRSAQLLPAESPAPSRIWGSTNARAGKRST